MDALAAEHYLVRRISPKERISDLLRFPRYFEIETVNACNARCPMCTIADWQRHSPVMKMDLFGRIADELRAHAGEIKRVSLYRDGEPLLDKKLAERIAILKDGAIRRVGISTNVSLLDEDAAVALLEAGLDEVVLSIDSLKKPVYEAIRVRLDFDEVIENALRFIELRNRIRPGCEIWMRMVRQQSNVDEWPAYRDYWRPRLAPHDRCYYINIHNWGGQLDGYRAVSDGGHLRMPCVALWSLMVIFSNGDVPQCNVDYNNTHPLGNLREASIAELWRSRLAHHRRGLHLTGARGEMDLCRNCTVWEEPNHAGVGGTAVAVSA